MTHLEQGFKNNYNMLNDIVEKINNIHQQMENLSREITITQRSQMEMLEIKKKKTINNVIN